MLPISFIQVYEDRSDELIKYTATKLQDAIPKPFFNHLTEKSSNEFKTYNVQREI